MGEILQQVVNTVRQLEAFDYAVDANAHNTRTGLVNQVQQFYNQFRDPFRQHARPRLPDTDALAEIRALLPELHRTSEATREAQNTVARQLDEVERLESGVRDMIQRLTDAAASSAGHTLSKHYKEQKLNHDNASKRWLIASALILVTLGVVAAFAFHGIAVTDKAGKDVSSVTFARDAISRLLYLGLIGYALSICARGYRSQTHLAIVCQQKANALDTFPLFQETVSTDPGKEAVTAELVRAVFATSDSGYLDASGDKTIVEQQGAALTSLLAARRG